MTIETIRQLFRVLAPEFADVQDEELTTIITLNDSKLNSLLHDDVRDEAIVYLTAHMIDLGRKRKGAGGVVSSVTEGRLSIQYYNNASIKDEFDYSNYGRRYKSIIYNNIATVIV